MNTINILVPNLPESVTDATIASWHKKVGDNIQRDEILVELETDKIMLEVPAPESGILTVLLEKEGSIVTSGQILGSLSLENYQNKLNEQDQNKEAMTDNILSKDLKKENNDTLSPVARRLIATHNLHSECIKGSGVKGRITREDIEEYVVKNKSLSSVIQQSSEQNIRSETRIPMTRLRKIIAERLLDVKNNTAMLTTFNEVNMKPIKKLREEYGEEFKKRHDTKLGFMSFFIKSALKALKVFPEVNASIDGEEIVYRNYFDISIAVSTSRGLVTPVLKDVDLLSIADIEKYINYIAMKARDGKLKIEELNGGNFTITNGGIFGSLMSTPIINPPQTAILGMHAIKERPMAINGQVKILPMMYLALSYDHRIIDGKDSVNFLVMIKDILENPVRLLLDI